MMKSTVPPGKILVSAPCQVLVCYKCCAGQEQLTPLESMLLINSTSGTSLALACHLDTLMLEESLVASVSGTDPGK